MLSTNVVFSSTRGAALILLRLVLGVHIRRPYHNYMPKDSPLALRPNPFGRCVALHHIADDHDAASMSNGNKGKMRC